VKKGKEISAELQGFAFAKRIAERRKLNEAAGGEWAENLLAITASVIYDVITAPILARIRREEERAV
jgi:hypothetical protein